MAEDKVQISSKLLAVLVVSLLGAFVIIAFLLGRESVKTTGIAPQIVSQQPPAQYAQVPAPETPAVPSTPEAYHSSLQATSTIPAELPASTRTAALNPPPVQPSTPPKAQQAPVSGLNAQVEKYFIEFDAIGSSAKYWDDPNNLAQECIKASLGGDTSGIDKLIEAYRTFQYGIVKLDAPAPCKEHKSKTIEVLGYSIQILENMKNGIVKGDVSALVNLQTQATSVKQKGEEVDRLAEQIKSQYGIK